MQLFRLCLLFPMFVAPVLAADADNGKRLAEARCGDGSFGGTNPRREVADAPPFDVIARKFEVLPQTLAFAILQSAPQDERAVDAPRGGRSRPYQHTREIAGRRGRAGSVSATML